MSRGQQQGVISTAQGVQATDQALANTSFTNAQTDLGKTQDAITGYGDELSKFKANNPYATGGEFQTASNQQLADVAAGQAEAAGQTLQSQAVRTGQNAGGAIAATEHMQQQNDRDLMGAEAQATKDRLAAGTGYGEAVLGGTAAKEGMQGDLAKTQGQLGAEEGGLAQGALSTEEQAAQTPSFMEELGKGAIDAGVAFAGSYGKAKGCWIAAAVFDEDFTAGAKTNLVRRWLWNTWIHNWYAKPILWLYSKFGERLARQPVVVDLLRPLFEMALRKAVKNV